MSKRSYDSEDDASEPARAFWKGECQCTQCDKKAYHIIGSNQPRCGRHRGTGRRLRENPNRGANEAAAYAERMAIVNAQKDANAAAGRPGTVMCTKINGLFSKPQEVVGFALVLPNFKDGNKANAFGKKYLSPKSLGPLLEPLADNLENAWQFSKVWKHELDANGDPTDEWWAMRRNAFADPVPHRHKFDAATMKRHGYKNAPEFSLFVGPDKSCHRLSYVQARYFYCYWMERMLCDPHYVDKLKSAEMECERVKNGQRELADLRALRAAGMNLNLSGYDAYQPDRSLYEHYTDNSRPFGHELVIYTLLTLGDTPDEYPWRKYRAAHPELYAGWI